MFIFKPIHKKEPSEFDKILMATIEKQEPVSQKDKLLALARHYIEINPEAFEDMLKRNESKAIRRRLGTTCECTNCSGEIDLSDDFCKHCGQRLTTRNKPWD